jgi:TPR repeat protein
MSALNRLKKYLPVSMETIARGLLAGAAFSAALAFTSEAWGSPGSELARRDYDRGNYAAALQKAQPLADSGDNGAQMLLGMMYADGKGRGER